MNNNFEDLVICGYANKCNRFDCIHHHPHIESDDIKCTNKDLCECGNIHSYIKCVPMYNYKD